MYQHFHLNFPGANAHHLPEWYSTDTLIADLPVIDNVVPGLRGCTLIQIYSGLNSELLSGHPMSLESNFSDTLHDFTCKYGAMEGLKSDNVKCETSLP